MAPQPSPNARAKAEATKRYIENLYSERNKAAAARLQRRNSLDTVAGKQVSHLSPRPLGQARSAAVSVFSLWPPTGTPRGRTRGSSAPPEPHLRAPRACGTSHATRTALAFPHALPQLSDEERSARLAELERQESEYTRLQRQKISVDDFEPLTIIGRGAFGEVRGWRKRVEVQRGQTGPLTRASPWAVC